MGAYGERGDHHTLKQLVGILMHDVAVFERSRFGFIAVTDEVNGLGVVRWDESPLHARWEASTTTTSEASGFNFIGDGLGLHRDRFFQLIIAAVFEVAIDRRIPSSTVDVFKDQAVLTRVRFFARDVGDFTHT